MEISVEQLDAMVRVDDEEGKVIALSQFLNDAEKLKRNATWRGDDKALNALKPRKTGDTDEYKGSQRAKILDLHDSGQASAVRITANLIHALQSLNTDNPSVKVTIDASGRTRVSIVKAVRHLIIAVLAEEEGKRAIERGLLKDDQMNQEQLRLRTQYDDPDKETAREGRVQALKRKLFSEYLRMKKGKKINVQGKMDIHLVTVAVRKELHILKELIIPELEKVKDEITAAESLLTELQEEEGVLTQLHTLQAAMKAQTGDLFETSQPPQTTEPPTKKRGSESVWWQPSTWSWLRNLLKQ